MVNRGITQYSKKEKLLYKKYGIRSKGRKSGVSGKGRYQMRGMPGIRGQGGYFADLWKRIPRNFFNARKLGENLGGNAGAAIGNMIAPGVGGESFRQVGSSLGSELGGLFKSITGFGDYRIKSNSLLPGGDGDRVIPSFGDDSIRVKKREFITFINASTSFQNNSFPVNPGLSEVFPWLSAIANNYEQYRWNGLLFQFVSTSSDAIASTTDLGLGQVILASDYNAADAPYQNQPQMLGAMFSNSGKPSENIIHAVECAPTDTASKLYYTRSGAVPENQDIRLYDMLSFQLATANMPATYSGMGQLWVTYDVTFCKSQQNNQLGFDLNTDKYIFNTYTNNTPLGPTGGILTPVDHSNLGTIVTPTRIAFPVDLSSGYYLINIGYAGASVGVTFPSTTGTGCSKVDSWINDTSVDFVAPTSTTANTRLAYMGIWRIDSRDAAIDFATDGNLPATGGVADLLITQINGEIFDD